MPPKKGAAGAKKGAAAAHGGVQALDASVQPGRHFTRFDLPKDPDWVLGT